MKNDLMIFERKDHAVVSSRVIAERFNKRHDNLLQSIQTLKGGLLENKETPSDYFIKAWYTEEQNGQTYSEYLCTRDGFTLLVMGYTGELAMKFKEGYIKQFNAMDAALRGKLVEREKGIAVRQALTKALQQSTENARMHGHAYSNYLAAGARVAPEKKRIPPVLCPGST